MRIIHTGDYHFGNISTPTKFIINNLEKYLIPNLKNNDLLIIAGDIFDKNLSLNNTDTHHAIGFFSMLFKLANKLNLTIRAVRGTYSHDRNQISILSTLYANNKFTFDFKYIDSIQFEYIKKYDLRFCYIPDDLSFNSDLEIIRHIKQRLEMLGWDKVDYLIGHGNFKHTFPYNIKIYPKNTFSIEQFKNIVSKHILFGHVHVPSVTKNMIYCGSFDRLRHGERGKKGYFIIEDNKVSFIENSDCMVFKDFIWQPKYKDDLNRLDNFIKKNYSTRTGYIRLFNIVVDFKQSVISFLSSKYPNIKFTFFKAKAKKININDKFKIKRDVIIPNEMNLASIISDFAKKKFNVSIDNIEKYFKD